jgi:hypothetical protein
VEIRGGGGTGMKKCYTGGWGEKDHVGMGEGVGRR